MSEIDLKELVKGFMRHEKTGTCEASGNCHMNWLLWAGSRLMIRSLEKI